jgi:hypothetical protein
MQSPWTCELCYTARCKAHSFFLNTTQRQDLSEKEETKMTKLAKMVMNSECEEDLVLDVRSGNGDVDTMNTSSWLMSTSSLSERGEILLCVNILETVNQFNASTLINIPFYICDDRRHSATGRPVMWILMPYFMSQVKQ